MANYRLDDHLSQQYRTNQQTISERDSQPVSAPLGNYRIDKGGRLVLPPNQLLEGDESFASHSRKVYHLDDYTQANVQAPIRGDHPFYEHDRSLHPARSSNYRMDYANDYQLSDYPSEEGQPWPNHLQNHVHRWTKMHRKRSFTAGLPKGKWKLLFIYLLIYSAMVWAGWQIMPFNKVNQLAIVGNRYLSPEAILQGINIYPMDRVEDVLEERKAIEDHILANNPLIEDVTISREQWSALTFTIVEHQVVARYQNENGTYALLSNGSFSEGESNLEQLDPERLDTLPVVKGQYQEEKLAKLAESLKQIDDNILKEMETIYPAKDPSKTGHILVQMKDGNQIQAVIATFAQKVNYYPNIVKQLEGRKGIIDIEVGAYFTPYEENTDSVKLDNN
ncbi:FtsQ-type POTRA domain-containing protein [Facklamia sp. DSM 111018]|uniref:FtsQ-type POTRA domain-containing protein n=1 Tax=Facklamia lactis TaxID=2749967 RepID=A0ABS0LND6_9LACT|nr:FtsQ-type POTRA domain-containing protein [Facklamia lactis]MBG9985676.1 FtsQ-type POTRA domain-containing protein [Facklamia lactis]